MTRKRSRRKTSKNLTVYSSDSEEGPTKKGRGRPAKDPSHEGQFTAEAMARKAEAEKAKKLRRDHRAILDSDVKPTSERASKANDEALERAEELEAQPLTSVAEVMTQSLGMLAKSVERSNNIQGPIRKDMWRAYTDLTTGLTTAMYRQCEDDEARQHRENSAALAKARTKWEAEKRKLEAEIGQLRIQVALLEQSPHSRAEAEGHTDVEDQTDLDLDVEVMDALTGEAPHPPGPTLTDTMTEEPSGRAPSKAATTRQNKPVVRCMEVLKKPYFRPPLKGVRKQMNPLSNAADIKVASVSQSSFPSLPPPSRPLERAVQTGGEERRKKKAITEDGLREVLTRVLPAVLQEMGLLPARATTAERPGTVSAGGRVTTPPQTETAPKKKTAGGATATTARPAPGRETTSPSILELWTEVVSRKAKRAAKASNEATKAATATGRPIRKKRRGGRGGGQGERAGQPRGGTSHQGSASVAKIKPPTTAAVTVTCADPTAYAQVLKTAREKVDLFSLGIEDLRPRRAVTGALILEVRGVDNGTKADALAEGIRAALSSRDDVKVARPCKTVELRLTGLDDSVTPSEVAEVLGAIGACSPHDIKVGEIRMAPNGLGTCWVRCPAKAGKAVLAAPRIRLLLPMRWHRPPGQGLPRKGGLPGLQRRGQARRPSDRRKGLPSQ
ncbi:uncharacterized protein LOC120358938 [Solenopsis invicta]|uniref:uncharacterized protein LOC120358938 n=1 Tax=Solenopsis invicta TaxID=13686 RepID=UPI00193CA06A|nr:uncharacterized protein LOC120358938 [Solenopsis invicta]